MDEEAAVQVDQLVRQPRDDIILYAGEVAEEPGEARRHQESSAPARRAAYGAHQPAAHEDPADDKIGEPQVYVGRVERGPLGGNAEDDGGDDHRRGQQPRTHASS